MNKKILFLILSIFLVGLFFGIVRELKAELQCDCDQLTFYYKPGCGHCNSTKPHIQTLESTGAVNVTRVNTDSEPYPPWVTGLPSYEFCGSRDSGGKNLNQLKSMLGCKDVPAPPPPAVCGNGIVEPGEGCDDGNTVSGDGCDSNCQIEGGPPPPAAACGNGVVEAGEQCDDGNTVSGDGCDSNCQVEGGPGPGPAPPAPVGGSPTFESPFGRVTFDEMLTRILSWLWPLSGAIAVLMILVGAYFMVLSGGNPEKIATGRKIVIYALIGFGIVTIATGIVALVRLILNI